MLARHKAVVELGTKYTHRELGLLSLVFLPSCGSMCSCYTLEYALHTALSGSACQSAGTEDLRGGVSAYGKGQ
jgi:hypothetical protein